MSTAGYSGTPLFKKLGIKDGHNCHFKNIPDHYFDLLFDLPDIIVHEHIAENSLDFIHLFCLDKAELESNFSDLKSALNSTGSLWVSWPKKISKIKSDLDGNIIRTYGLSMGLVDVKVAAIDSDWSGLKFMYRVKDR